MDISVSWKRLLVFARAPHGHLLQGMNFPEIIFFAVLGLLVFGPKRLPEIARVVAKTMNELRRASNEFKQSLEDEIHNLETPAESQAHRDLLPNSVEPYTGRDLDPAWDSELDEFDAGAESAGTDAESAEEEDALAEAEWSREDDAAVEDEFLNEATDDWTDEHESVVAGEAAAGAAPPAPAGPEAHPASLPAETAVSSAASPPEHPPRHPDPASSADPA